MWLKTYRDIYLCAYSAVFNDSKGIHQHTLCTPYEVCQMLPPANRIPEYGNGSQSTCFSAVTFRDALSVSGSRSHESLETHSGSHLGLGQEGLGSIPGYLPPVLRRPKFQSVSRSVSLLPFTHSPICGSP